MVGSKIQNRISDTIVVNGKITTTINSWKSDLSVLKDDLSARNLSIIYKCHQTMQM